jgi:hypothetical protein
MIKIQKTIHNEDIKYLKISKEMRKCKNNRFDIIENFSCMMNRSSEENAIWINENENEIIIGFKDTTKCFRDFFTTTPLYKGLLKDTSRFKDSLLYVKEMKDNFKNYKYIFTGSGLGGFIAIEMLWIYNNDKSVTFNAGCESKHRYNGLHVRYYTAPGDKISIYNKGNFEEYIFIDNDNNKNTYFNSVDDLDIFG